jgi:hypothetical protein
MRDSCSSDSTNRILEPTIVGFRFSQFRGLQDSVRRNHCNQWIAELLKIESKLVFENQLTEAY